MQASKSFDGWTPHTLTESPGRNVVLQHAGWAVLRPRGKGERLSRRSLSPTSKYFPSSDSVRFTVGNVDRSSSVWFLAVPWSCLHYQFSVQSLEGRGSVPCVSIKPAPVTSSRRAVGPWCCTTATTYVSDELRPWMNSLLRTVQIALYFVIDCSPLCARHL